MVYTHSVRVRYAECDQMGFLHHSIYALYLEEARTEQMRSKGITYKAMEDNGLIMPVRSMSFEFKKAARYDDLLRVEVWIPEKPNVRCTFHYRILNQRGELLSTAQTEMFYARKSDLRPVKVPQEIIDKYEF